MKRLILLLLLIGTSIYSFGQKPLDEYAYLSDAQVLKWDEGTHHISTDHIYYRAVAGYRFVLREHIKYTDADKKIISGWRIVFVPFKAGKQSSNAAKENAQATLQKNISQNGTITIINDAENGMPFFISDDDLTQLATDNFRKPNGLVKIDGVVLPIKVRFKNNQPGGIFDFTQSVSVGPVVALNQNYGGPFGHNSVTVLAGINITNVPVDEKTVPGVITSKTTLLGLSPIFGVNIEYSGVSFGFMTGIDILTGDAGQKWAYRKSPWLGLSIGTSLTSIVSGSTGQKAKTSP